MILKRLNCSSKFCSLRVHIIPSACVNSYEIENSIIDGHWTYLQVVLKVKIPGQRPSDQWFLNGKHWYKTVSIAHCAEIRVFKIITFSLLSTTRAHFVTICVMICHIERVFLQMFVFHCICSLIVEAEHCKITRLVHSVFRDEGKA